MSSTALAPVPTAAALDRGYRRSSDVIERTRLVREVMEAVMKDGTHFGTIPGTPKPSLFQPGADVLAVTFRIAPKVQQLEDLSTADSVRYRVTVAGVHQESGHLLAEGIGECSSDEEKYRWRRPVCDAEFEEAPQDRRRAKWAKGQGGKPYQQKQLRTSPADVANTVLKMATKRAKVAMILNATAASDVFAQDLEDLDDELRERVIETVPMPQAKGAAPASAPVTSQEDRPAPPALATPATPNTAFTRDHVRITHMEPRMTKPKVNQTTGEETPGQPFAVVTLSTGEKFQCFHRNLNAQLETWWKGNTVIDVDCKTSSKGAEFMPLIEKAAAVQS